MSALSQRTATFLISEDKVLLGYKKTGFGKGNYLGIGGKLEAGESELEAAAREIQEEIEVTEPVLEKVGDLTFLFPEKPDWSQQVHIFLCSTWQGEPTETEEIKPEWRSLSDLPFTQMWDDAKFWLPAILNGHRLQGMFTFNTDLQVVKCSLVEL